MKAPLPNQQMLPVDMGTMVDSAEISSNKVSDYQGN